MVDTRTPAQRRRIMQAVNTKDTGPEWVVRRLLHRAGYRYRLHRKELPGRPDVVFPRRRKVIFVHGCFWHQHPGCRKATIPKNNAEFWRAKLNKNTERDKRAVTALHQDNWEVVTIWECELKDEMKPVTKKLNGVLPRAI